MATTSRRKVVFLDDSPVGATCALAADTTLRPSRAQRRKSLRNTRHSIRQRFGFPAEGPAFRGSGKCSAEQSCEPAIIPTIILEGDIVTDYIMKDNLMNIRLGKPVHNLYQALLEGQDLELHVDCDEDLDVHTASKFSGDKVQNACYLLLKSKLSRDILHEVEKRGQAGAFTLKGAASMLCGEIAKGRSCVRVNRGSMAKFHLQAVELCKTIRECQCLNAEIDFLMIQRQLLRGAPGHCQRESHLERAGRDREFWKLYHTHDGNMPPVVSTVKRASASIHTKSHIRTPMLESRGAFWAPTICHKAERKFMGINTSALPPSTANGHQTDARRAPIMRSSSTRSVAIHRKCVHQRRIGNDRAELKPEADALGRIAPLSSQLPGSALSGSSSDEDEARGNFFDVGGFLEPSARQGRSKKVKQAIREQLSTGSEGRVVFPSIVSTSRELVGRDTEKTMTKSVSDSVLRPTRKPSLRTLQTLPPMYDKARPLDHNPWQSPARIGNAKSRAAVAATRYIHVCNAAGVVPSPVALGMARLNRIEGHAESFTDDDLRALAAMVRSLESLQSVDLSGNSLLSERALVVFLRKLFGRPVAGSLTFLNLCGCKGAGRKVVETIVSLLTEPEGLHLLRYIGVSEVPIPCVCHLPLAQAVGTHSQLRVVHLANTGLGFHGAADRCITSILKTHALQELDLGWNCFSSDTFEVLGNGMCDHETLQRVYLANCTASTGEKGGTPPITWMLEALARNRSLKVLDISLNHIDYRGAFVLEDALEFHRKLTVLHIGDNPFGVFGLRCLLRLLSRETSGLKMFECNNCEGDIPDSDEQGFDATNPTGHYKLDLRLTYHRAILRTLYKTCQRFNLQPDRAFLDLEFTLPKVPSKSSAACAVYRHPRTTDAKGVWAVPNAGSLVLNFSIDEALSALFANGVTEEQSEMNRLAWLNLPERHEHFGAPEDRMATSFLERLFSLVRFQPSFHKVIPVLAQWRKVKSRVRDQDMFLDALSRDFLLRYSHIEQLCRIRVRAVDVIHKLLPCMLGNSTHYFLTMTIPKHLDEHLDLVQRCQPLLSFNIENPTAHYLLDLGDTSEFAIAQSIWLIDRWEAVMARERGVFDMSMHGNWSNIRNCLHMDKSINDTTKWHLPSCGMLMFDYASWRRPSHDQEPLAQSRWRNVLHRLEMSLVGSPDKVKALRCLSDQLYLDTLQLRVLLNMFGDPNVQLEVLTCFLLRLVDPQNLKVVRARVGCDTAWARCTQRLGMLALLPYCQPEEANLTFDLNVYECRVAGSIIVQLALLEGLVNLRGVSLRLPDGRHFDFCMGIPTAWKNHESMPLGVFRLRYTCSPENRKFPLRVAFARKYGGLRLVEEPKMMWWSDISVVPDVVMSFVNFSTQSYADLEELFIFFDGGPGGNLELTHMELRGGIERLGWPGFRDNNEKIKEVFRYLDPNQGGTISLLEWSAVVQIAKEIQLSVLEFVQFLNRSFAGNFAIAWHEIDADGNGSIDFNEWDHALGLIGYFGPRHHIFNYIATQTDERTPTQITRADWSKLVAVLKDSSSLMSNLMVS